MDELLARIGQNLIDRVSGPFQFRLWLQPAVALFFGIRDGLRDAREGKPPYFWAIFTHPGQRLALLYMGWQSVARVFIVAIVIDVIYQLIVLRFLYPGEALLVGLLLALLPYLLIRGPVNRIFRPIRKQGR